MLLTHDWDTKDCPTYKLSAIDATGKEAVEYDRTSNACNRNGNV